MRPRRGPAPPVFEIWQVGERIASIDNAVRLAILKALETKPRTLNDIVALTGKAKSTLSALHVKPLLQLGLVRESGDPDDARVKWYILEGHRLGSSAVGQAELRDAVLGYVRASGFVPLRPLLDIIDVPNLVQGPPAYAAAVGSRIGRLVGRTLTGKTPQARAEELDAILHGEGLGRVTWQTREAVAKAHDAAAQGFLAALSNAALNAKSPGAQE